MPWLTLIPGSSIFFPWTLVTSVFVERSIIELIVSIIVIPPSLRYLERLWGARETFKFLLWPLLASNVVAFGFNWIEFIATKNVMFLNMEYHGQMAIQTAVLVAFTQLIPEHQVQVMGVLRARVKTLPMAYLTLSTVMCLIGYQCPWIIIQFAWLFSYLWLRLYKKSEDSLGHPIYGDRSETFAFVQWFPPFLHTPMSLLSNTAYNLGSKFHLIPSSAPDVESGGYTALPGPGSTRAEAERRRAMALKALDQRVANASPAPPEAASSSAAKAAVEPPSKANAPTTE